MKIVILIVMFFCHIVDDYYLQGCLANMKQATWWEQYGGVYRNDYQKPNIKITNVSNDNYDRDIYDDDNIISYKYYSPMVNIQSKKPFNNMQNNNILNDQQNQLYMNNNYNNFQNYNQIVPQQEQEYINDNIDFSAPDDYDFFDNEQKHLQKVQNKIMNLKNEKITKLEEQCTFTPQINTNHKFPNNMKNTNNNNTFEKLYNDSSVNKIKKEERIKKYLEEFKFAPNIEVNDKYRIKRRHIEEIDIAIKNNITITISNYDYFKKMKIE